MKKKLSDYFNKEVSAEKQQLIVDTVILGPFVGALTGTFAMAAGFTMMAPAAGLAAFAALGAGVAYVANKLGAPSNSPKP